ncbi:hypothetical protein MVEN_00525800 [Mycena venus]|uniref:Uncharacterized protein n=1 Tax=Mycena venus TaxID=2733690 RepID=A0A8H6YNA6_9AGAR|nr:hypothetical protein MVEN_00525800 [Mycena venus]
MSNDFRTDFKTTVKQEEWYLRRVYPTPNPHSLMHKPPRHLFLLQCRTEPQKWAEYKFCMSLKWMGMDERRDAWIRRKAIWWAKRRLGKSSEDVWQVRDEPLQNFPKPLDPAQYLRERPHEFM